MINLQLIQITQCNILKSDHLDELDESNQKAPRMWSINN